MSDPSFDPEMLAELDRAHVWHPFTHMRQYLAGEPLIIAEGRGVRLRDVHGRWYFDGTSSIWVNIHGHRVDAIDRAITDQLGRVAHSTLLGQANVPSIELARRLVEVTPSGLERVFYSDSGATAVEIALKLAIQYWANRGERSRRYILGFTNNYHGDTLGAVGVAPDELFHWPFLDLLPNHPRAPYPNFYRCTHESPAACCAASLEGVERLLEERGCELAGVIVEPVQGAGGIIPAPEGFLSGLRQLCDRYHILLIVDEVATGFGRTGHFFACDAEDVTPDLMCLGKGLTGGYLPLAATLTTEAVFNAFLGEVDEGRTFFHGHSYTGNPLGCAAALASLDLLEDLLPELKAKIRLVSERLAQLRDHPYVGDLRQAGLMVGIEIVTDRPSKRSFPYAVQIGYVVADEARARGLLVRPIGGVLIFMPPLGSSLEELTEMTAILVESFDAALPELERLAREARG